MKKKYVAQLEELNKIIQLDKIYNEIISEFEKKVNDTSIKLARFDSEEEKLKFLGKEHLELNQDIGNMPESLKVSADKYLQYLVEDRNDEVLRKNAISFFYDTWILNDTTNNEKKEDGLIEGTVFSRKEIITEYIKINVILEYNVFVAKQIFKIKLELTERENFNKNKLECNGTQTELSDKQRNNINLESTERENFNKNKLEWNGTQTELIELIKALIENGNVKGVQKDIIKKFTVFFCKEIKNPDKLIQDIKNRNNQSETLFLDKLKSKLFVYLKKSKG